MKKADYSTKITETKNTGLVNTAALNTKAIETENEIPDTASFIL